MTRTSTASPSRTHVPLGSLTYHFDSLADLKRSLRNSLRYFQTMRERVRSLINKRPRAKKTGQHQ